MMLVTSISEILDHFNIDEEDATEENSYVSLKRAIAGERVSIDDDLLCFSLCRPAKFFRAGAKGDEEVAKFRPARGGDQRIFLNSGGKNIGDCLFRVIGRLCGITDKSLDEQPIRDVKVMEDIANLFL